MFIYARLKGSLTFRRIIQPVTTILVIILAASGFLVPGGNTIYTMLIVFGLIFCLVGDCYLVDFTDNTLFITAVGFYCTGLIVYSVILTRWTGFNLVDLAALILLLIGSGLILILFLYN